MAKRANLTTKASEPDKVDACMKKLKHPPKPVVAALREVILGIDDEIGEEIKWNAPTFFYGGPMKAFNPREYRRYIVIFNLSRKDCIRLVFPSGVKIGDKSGLLEGDYADGRRLALFASMDEVWKKQPAMQATIQKWLRLLDHS